MAIPASEARKSLLSLIEQVNKDQSAIEITSDHGSAFLVSEAEWRSLEETAYLLRSTANARRLMAANEQINSARTIP